MSRQNACALGVAGISGAAGGFAPAFELGDAGLWNASDDAVRPDLLELEVFFQ